MNGYPSFSKGKVEFVKAIGKSFNPDSGALSKVYVHETDPNTLCPVPGTNNSLVECRTGACLTSKCIAYDNSIALRCDTCHGVFHGQCVCIDRRRC